MLDAIEELEQKVETQIATLNKMLAQYEIGLQKLDGIASVYGQKIKNEIKINARAKAALEPLLAATGDAFNMATSNTANFLNFSKNAADKAAQIHKTRTSLVR